MRPSVNEVKSGIHQTKNAGAKPVWIVAVNDGINQGRNGITRYYFDKADRKLWKQEIAVDERKFLMEAVE